MSKKAKDKTSEVLESLALEKVEEVVLDPQLNSDVAKDGVIPDTIANMPVYKPSHVRHSVDETRQAQAEDRERAQAFVDDEEKHRNAGRSSWKSGARSYKRDIFAVYAVDENGDLVPMVNGRHPKYPGVAFRWIKMSRVDERRRAEERWQVTSMDMFDEVSRLQPESGVNKGVGSAMQRQEMVLMYTHEQYMKDREEHMENLTGAQEADCEEAAIRMGLTNVRPGHFGTNKLVQHNRSRENYAKGQTPRMESNTELDRRVDRVTKGNS